MGAVGIEWAVTRLSDDTASDPLPPRHTISVRRLKWSTYDPQLRTMVLRGFGFMYECSCGGRGKAWRTYEQARGDGNRHATEAT